MEHWTFVVGVDPGGNQTITYVSAGTIEGTIASGRQQTYLYLDEPLTIGDQLRNVHDTADQPLFKVGDTEQNQYVHAVSPVVDVYGRVRNHRHVIRNYAPTDPVGGQHGV